MILNKVYGFFMLLPLVVTFVSCSQPSPQAPIELPIPAVGIVELEATILEPEQYQLLDIGIKVFDISISEEEALELGEWIFTEIRENETHYLPYVLRSTLVASNQWGPVRVLPLEDPSMDLLISATVLASDGQRLTMNVEASDSTGRLWLDKDYADQSLADDFPVSTRYTPGNQFDSANFTEPFQDIYDQVNNDLVDVRSTLSTEDLVNIKRVSQLVYAGDLAPESFAENLGKNELGRLTVVTLPAADDPQLRRVNEMRQRHHLFIDTVDQYYESLYEEMQAAYVVWRKYSYDQIEEERIAASESYDFNSYGRSRSYLTLTQRYDRYRWSKIFEMEYRDLSLGFSNEIAPAILELNEQVHGLSGTMEEQYIQWRRILQQLFKLEEEVPD
jgi:hypothetical protein